MRQAAILLFIKLHEIFVQHSTIELKKPGDPLLTVDTRPFFIL